MLLRLVPSLGHVFLSYPAFPSPCFLLVRLREPPILWCMCRGVIGWHIWAIPAISTVSYVWGGSCWLPEWGVTKRFILFCLLTVCSWSSDPLTRIFRCFCYQCPNMAVSWAVCQHPRRPSPFCTTMNFISGVPFSLLCINKVSLGGDESWLVQGYLCPFCKCVFIVFVKYIQCQELYKSWLIWSQQSYELRTSNNFMLQMRQGKNKQLAQRHTASPGEPAFLSTWADFRVFTWLCLST